MVRFFRAVASLGRLLSARPEYWAAGEMVCLGCGHDRGVHCWLVGSEPVECPECGEALCVPRDGMGFAPSSVLERFGKNPG